MPRIVISLFLALFLVASCQSGSKAYMETLQKWQGRHIDELAAAWGPADYVHQNRDGGKLYRWDTRRLASRLAAVPYGGFWGPGWGWGGWSGWGPWGAWGGGSYREYYTRWCETIITTDTGGYITKWSFRGNGCRDLVETRSDDAPSQ